MMLFVRSYENMILFSAEDILIAKIGKQNHTFNAK